MTATTSAPHKVHAHNRTYEFSDRQKVQKESEVATSGDIVTKFIFRNGEVREHITPISSPIFARAALHGLDQKFGDEFAGETDVEDCVEAFEALSERLNREEWREKKAEGVSGTSMLLRALMEYTGKGKDELKTALRVKTAAQKKALSAQKDIAKIIARLKAERGEKPVDQAAADNELASMLA